MADTIRTLAELNALFSDNGIGNVSAQDIRDMLVSINVYGEIGAMGKAPVDLATGWQALDFDTEGNSTRGLNVDTVNNSIDQIPVDMEADVTLTVLFKGDTGKNYDFTVFKDPLGSPAQQTRMNILNVEAVTAAQVICVTWTTSLALSAGDVLQAAVKPQTLDDSFELLQGALRVQRKGIE